MTRTVPEGLLTLTQAAEELRVSTTTLSRMMREHGNTIAGELVGYQLGREWRFTRRGIDLLLGKRAVIETPVWEQLFEG